MKKILSFVLVLIFILGLCACGTPAKENKPQESQTQQTPGEVKSLKILTLGHSLALDSGHMLAMIAEKEGELDLTVGTLYFSGCPLNKHVEFMNSDSTAYKLYISSTKTAGQIPQVMQDMTMRRAVAYDRWDIIIMQGGVFEIAEKNTYTSRDIQKIQEFVNENKLNPDAVFAWHMPWAPPTDNNLRDTYPYDNNTYYTSYLPYGNDRTTLYKAITKCVGEHILTDETFTFMIPTGTAMENALSSYLEETDLHRDYVHASDLGRVIASYTWYCKLAGIEKLEEIKLDAIPQNFLKSIDSAQDYVLTDMEKDIILESVNNALAQPLQMTQSQYTTAPTA